MIATTKEQSKRLLKCGVPAETADMCYDSGALSLMDYDSAVHERDSRRESYEVIPAWSLSALLGLLPKTIKLNRKVHTLDINTCNDGWTCGYYFWEYDIKTFRNYIESYTLPCYSEELIDALYELLIQCLDKRLCQI